jgi:hypothetical protein
MIEHNTQLLCTFSKKDMYQEEIESISEYYQIVDGKVYVLESKSNSYEIFLTYNVVKNGGQFYPNTISVHRKKEFNIIYSINALNGLILHENNGVQSSTHKIAWENYSNCFISARDGKVKITPTKLLNIRINE